MMLFKKKTFAWLATLPVILATIFATLAVAPPAQASPDGCYSYSGRGYYNRGYYQPRHKSYAQLECERGERAGWRAGQRQGYEDGYYGRSFNCVCTIDISCESRAFQRGFNSAFDRAYRSGFRAGQRQAEYERCRRDSYRSYGYRSSHRSYSRW